MQIILDLTTMRPETLAVIAADITHQIDAQDWTMDSYEAVEAILAHLAGAIGPDRMDQIMRDAEANASVYDLLTTGMDGQIS